MAESTPPLRIGNAQGFWGDQVDAAARLVAQQPDLDYLTLDYLAEVSMSIMAIQRERDPAGGYARDFIDVVRSLAPCWKQGSKVGVISNAGGLNPHGCAEAVARVLGDEGLAGMTIGVVSGDDVLSVIKQAGDAEEGLESLRNLETGEPIAHVNHSLVTANAYLGAAPVAEALAGGAQIVITGRVADPSLTVAPCVHRFGWSWSDYDRLAGATIAGHLIECGTQVTGGIATDWLDIPDAATMGFPIVEVSSDGSLVVTKPVGTGGRVDLRTVKEQLLYEIGDPDNYVSPDVTVSFLSLSLDDDGQDRVRVSGARGRKASEFYKVSATYRDGFAAQGQLVIVGRDAATKARRTGEVILDRVRQAGFSLDRSLIECLGAGDVVPGVVSLARDAQQWEVVLQISVADRRREAVERFTKEIAPLVTSGPAGTTGYATGRPKVRPVFGYWPCLIAKEYVQPTVRLMNV